VDQGWVATDPKLTGFRANRNAIQYITVGIIAVLSIGCFGMFMICGSIAAVISLYEMILSGRNAGTKAVKKAVYHVQRV
jgi:hypothetical protein